MSLFRGEPPLRGVSPLTLTYARWQDRWHPHAAVLLHPFDFRRRWFRELQGFYRHLAREEFWPFYRRERRRAQYLEVEVAEVEILEVYARTEWFILRQLYYRRDDCYHAVAATVPPGGWLLEFGAGGGPVTAWIRADRPDVKCLAVDLEDARTTAFLRWRWRHDTCVWVNPLTPFAVDCVTAFEVLEHLPDPLKTLEAITANLYTGGYLHLNLTVDEPKGLDLATPAQADAVRAWLGSSAWEAVVPLHVDPIHACYRKR